MGGRKKTVGADRLVAASFYHGFPFILEIWQGKCLEETRVMKEGDPELLLQELNRRREQLKFTLRPRPPSPEEFWEQAERIREEEAARGIYGVPF